MQANAFCHFVINLHVYGACDFITIKLYPGLLSEANNRSLLNLLSSRFFFVKCCTSQISSPTKRDKTHVTEWQKRT